MTFKLIPTAIACALAPFAVAAAPYCDALLDPAALPGKYARVAPIHSSTDTGWIFNDEMLTEAYDMKGEALDLTTRIIAEFTARDVPLAILVAPPRTIVAGQAVVDATAGAGAHDVEAARASFDALIGQLQDAGAIAPNLSDAALAAGDLRDAFYFKRDTHWTAIGAAISSQALGVELAAKLGDRGFAAPGAVTLGDGVEEEKGSLAAIVRDVCDIDPAHEAFALADFPSRGGDLLGDSAADPSVLLMGTSYSNRYKTDFYRVGEAMEWALDRDVQNMSEAGTGMIGIIEGVVLNGGLDAQPDLVVWETPYTESFNSTSNQRQLLGALQSLRATPSTQVAEGPVAATIPLGGDQPNLVMIRMGTTDPVELHVLVTLEDGKTKTVKLRRRDRVPGELRSDVIAASLDGFGAAIATVEVQVKSGDLAADAAVSLHTISAPNS